MKTNLPALRKARKISQEELARAVGVTRQTITSIEVGKYTASLPLAHKIAVYFGLSIEEVFLFEEELHMEPKQLAQFCHTLRLRIRLGIAYACLVLALLVLGAFTAQHGWYRGFLTGLLSGIDIVVMICVVRWRAMLRGTPDAQRRLEEACRREYDEREQFLWQKSARTAVWGALGLLLPAGVAALYFSRAAGFALMAAACVPLVINKMLYFALSKRY